MYFAGRADVAVNQSAPSAARLSDAAEAWDRTKDTASVAVLEAFMMRYTDTIYADLAWARAEELKKQQVAVKGDQDKQADERKRVEAAAIRKRAEDGERAAAETERQRLAMLEKEQQRKRTETETAKQGASTSGDSLKPGSVFRDCPACPEMVVVPAGEFIMGDDDRGPEHKVIINRPFAVGKFEVTFAEWDACVASRGCARKPGGAARGRRPVEGVSWDETTEEYLPWLSKMTKKSYRLLTEAEWEYAARAGTTTPYWTGRTITPQQATFGRQNHDGVKTTTVGSYAPNAFGLHDMHGNAEEWVQTVYKGDYINAPVDGTATLSGNCDYRIFRGGGWAS